MLSIEWSVRKLPFPYKNTKKEGKNRCRSSEGEHQIWPAYLIFKLTLTYGEERLSDTHVVVDPLQTWTIVIPAAIRDLPLPAASRIRAPDDNQGQITAQDLSHQQPTTAEQFIPRDQSRTVRSHHKGY